MELKVSTQPNGFGAGQDGELVDLATAKANLNITGTKLDVALQTMLSSVNAGIYRYTKRLFKRPGTDWEYLLRGSSSRAIALPQFPVPSITTFERGYMSDSGTWQKISDVETSEYYLDVESGTLFHSQSYGAWGVSDVHRFRILFPGGPVTPPDDIVEAVIIWLGVKYERMKDHRWDRASEGFQSNSKTFFQRDIPKDVRIILNRHRRMEAIFV